KLDAYAVFEDREGTLWIGTSAGVYTRPAEASAFTLHDPRLTSVQSFAQDENGSIWITDDKAGVRALQQSERPIVAPTRLPLAGSQLLHDGRGTIWFAAL